MGTGLRSLVSEPGRKKLLHSLSFPRNLQLPLMFHIGRGGIFPTETVQGWRRVLVWHIHSKPVYCDLMILISNTFFFLAGWAFY